MSRALVKKLSLFSIIALSLVLYSSSQAFAHRSGCHRWHSCPSDSGSYSCGDTGYTSGCGGTYTLPAYTYTPTITTQTTEHTESVPYGITTTYDFREYPGYFKLKQPGKPGTRTIVTTVTLSDGVETSRSDTSNQITTAPTNEVVIRGGRTRPVAKIYGIADSTPGFLGINKGKYNVWGKSRPNTKVHLFVEKDVAASTTTNSEGWFTFNNISLRKPVSLLQVFERVNSRIITISEKTTVNTKTKKITSEYTLLHPKIKTQ